MGFAIETERLVLRDLREDDLPVLIEQFADPASRDYILSSQGEETDMRAFVEAMMILASEQPRRHYGLAIMLKKDSSVIGSCTLIDVEPEGIEAKIGWHLANRHWGKGYATEAAGRLLDIGFEINEVSRILADCFASNVASIKVMEKIGMIRQRGGELVQRIRAMSYGEKGHIVRYYIWRDQWLSECARPVNSGVRPLNGDLD